MRHLVVALAWLAAATVASAQPPPPTVSLAFALIDASLIRGTVCCQSNPSLPTTGIGGSSVGILAGLDVRVSRRVGVDAELSLPAFASDEQAATKYLHKVRFRDTLLSGYVRFRLRPESTTGVHLLGGASLVFSNVQISSADLEFVPSMHYGPFGPYERWPYGERRFALSGGVDVPIGRGRVAVVPGVRLHYIFREEVMADQVGLGRWSIRPCIGVRVAF